MRNLPGVGPALKLKILEEATRTGYRHDPVVSQVMNPRRTSGTTHYLETVAFVLTHPTSEAGPEWRGFQVEAAQLGYKTELHRPWAEKIGSIPLSRTLWSRGIRLEWNRFAPVLLGSSLMNRGFARVQRDHYHSAQLALRSLRKAGFRRPGLLLNKSLNERSRRAYLAAFLAEGFPHECSDRVLTSASAPLSSPRRTELQRWLRHRKLDVVLADKPDWQKDLPEFSGLPFATLTLATRNGTMAGIWINRELLGRELMRCLHSLLRTNQLGVSDIQPIRMVAGEWVAGQSLACQ
jgi:hypothetical protein